MDENRGDHSTGRSKSSESARDLLSQSMYHLVRLTRLGLQAATSGIEKLEETMAERQRERGAEPKPMGEAPPPTRPSESKPSTMGEAGERHEGGSHDPGQSRY